MSANKPYHYQPAGELVVTTTGNIDNLDIEGCGLLLMNNASLATIRGLKAGFPGQRITIASIGAGQVDLAHQNGSSTAANRLLNKATLSPSPLAAGHGTATYQYDSTTARWRMVHHDSEWISVPYSAGDFTGSGTITWTVSSGNLTTFSYRLRGETMDVQFIIVDTSVSGTGTELRITIPGGFTSSKLVNIPIRTVDNATSRIGYARIAASATVIVCFVDATGLTNWAAAASTTDTRGQITFEVP